MAPDADSRATPRRQNSVSRFLRSCAPLPPPSVHPMESLPLIQGIQLNPAQSSGKPILPPLKVTRDGSFESRVPAITNLTSSGALRSGSQNGTPRRPAPVTTATRQATAEHMSRGEILMGGIWLGGMESADDAVVSTYSPPVIPTVDRGSGDGRDSTQSKQVEAPPAASVMPSAAPAASIELSPATAAAAATPTEPPPQPTDAESEAALSRMGSAVLGSLTAELTSLYLGLRGLTDADLAALGPMLSAARVESITTCNLSHNKLGDEGAASLARALSTGAPALQRLALHENRIGDGGMAALAHAMRPGGAPGLRELRIGFNQVGDGGIAALAGAWHEGGGREMLEVHAGSNLVSSAGLAALVAELHSAPQLRLLAFGSALGGNLIDDSGARALAGALRMNALRELTVRLAHNRLSERGVAELAATVRDCGPDMKVVT